MTLLDLIIIAVALLLVFVGKLGLVSALLVGVVAVIILRLVRGERTL